MKMTQATLSSRPERRENSSLVEILSRIVEGSRRSLFHHAAAGSSTQVASRSDQIFKRALSEDKRHFPLAPTIVRRKDEGTIPGKNSLLRHG